MASDTRESSGDADTEDAPMTLLTGADDEDDDELLGGDAVLDDLLDPCNTEADSAVTCAIRVTSAGSTATSKSLESNNCTASTQLGETDDDDADNVEAHLTCETHFKGSNFVSLVSAGDHSGVISNSDRNRYTMAPATSDARNGLNCGSARQRLHKRIASL